MHRGRLRTAINVKSEETERLTQEMTDLTGRERLEGVSQSELTTEQRVAKVLELGGQIAAALGPNPMQIEDLYDDATGLPV